MHFRVPARVTPEAVAPATYMDAAGAASCSPASLNKLQATGATLGAVGTAPRCAGARRGPMWVLPSTRRRMPGQRATSWRRRAAPYDRPGTAIGAARSRCSPMSQACRYPGHDENLTYAGNERAGSARVRTLALHLHLYPMSILVPAVGAFRTRRSRRSLK